MILNTIPEGDLIDVLVIFSELESNISEYNALKSASDFQKSSELTIQESLKLNKEHTIISETLEKTTQVSMIISPHSEGELKYQG